MKPGMERDADIIVAGGGDAGAAAALAAASAGLAVILVDAEAPGARARPEFDARVWALGAGSVAMLAALGVWRRCAAAAQPIRAVEVFEGLVGQRFGPGGAGALLRFGPETTDAPAFAQMIEDCALRPALQEALAAAQRVQVIAPARVVSASEGVAVLADGRRLGAALVVAADGRRSALARAAGLGWAPGRYDQTGLVATIRHSAPHGGVARQAFFPAGPFAMLPLTGDRCGIVWSEQTARAREAAALDDAAFLRALALRSGGLLGRIALAGPRAAFPLSMTLAYELTAPRLALLGDAAHGVHPLAGQGLNLGLRDGAALAQVLAEARRRGEDIGAVPVLRRYQAWRRFDSTAMASGFDLMARLFSNDFGPLSTLRRAGMRLTDAVAPLKRALAAEAAGQAGELPALMRGRAV